MARSSSGVRRTAAILNFFADHPGQSFTLTEIVRALKLSRATCHSFLAGLVEVGYLYRGSDKNYVLGPAVIHLAQVAAKHASPSQVLQPELRKLADEFSGYCGAYYLEAGDVVVLERAAAGAQVGWSAPPGFRFRLRAPFSAIFYAWRRNSEAEASAWMDSGDPPPTPEQRATTLEAMKFGRERGYLFGVHNERFVGDDQDVQMAFSSRIDLPTLILPRLEPNRDYPLQCVMAPIFDSHQQVAFVVSLMNFPGRFSSDRVETVGRRVREVCDRVTKFMGGRQPALEPVG
jgi:DNA-binding IclR family transcriptional regulator